VPNRWGRWAICALLGAALSALVWSARVELGAELQAFGHWVRSLGALAPLAFIGGYVIVVVAFVPALPLTLAGGAIFGPVLGIAYVFVAASLGACAAFLVARYVARAAVERRIASSPRFAAIDRAIADQGLRITLLLRLSPVFPFSLLNYALGLTRVRFAHYALACVAMLPATSAYVYLGSLVGDLAGLGGPPAAEQAASPWLQRGLTALGVAATLAVVVVVARIARAALAEATGEDGPEESV
jgi:uncharacterized membrane protein YdjX (TVP38/TMEM64 family)